MCIYNFIAYRIDVEDLNYIYIRLFTYLLNYLVDLFITTIKILYIGTLPLSNMNIEQIVLLK